MNAAMAAPGVSPEGDGYFPDHAVSDTRTASSEVAPARLPHRSATPPLPLETETDETYDHTDAFPKPPRPPPANHHPLPSPRSGRSLSLAQLSGPVKRKPLSTTASPAAVRFSKGAATYADIIDDLPRPEQRFARSCSLDSPTLYEFPDHKALLATATTSLNTVSWPASPDTSEPPSPVIDQFLASAVPIVGGAGDVQLRNIAGSNPAPAQTSHSPSEDDTLSAETASLTTQESVPYELDDLYSISGSDESDGGKRTTIIDTNTTKTMSMFARKSPPPHLNFGTHARDISVPATTTSTTSLEQSNLNKPLPKSPASSKISAFFGWANSPAPTAATDYSDKSFSPLPSPTSPKRSTAVIESYETLLSPKSPTFSNATEQNPLQYCEGRLKTPAESRDSTASLGELEEMEDELKGLGAELASSIRREMDLEDLVERMQEQINNPQAPGKRTSDYYSDSGYSSAKFSEYDQAKEEVSQIQRRAEQEKAQLRLELTSKLQDERSKRRVLDQQLQELSKRASQFDVVQLNNTDASVRVKELEDMCDDLSRRLSEEREVKNNFEDLLDALKGELQTAANERDNLRDEIVPQLRARVEGLEAEAADQAKLAYDTSKMQQELYTLRSQNAELKHTVATTPAPAPAPAPAARMSMGLSRSASVTAGSYRGKNRPQSIARSNTTRLSEPRDVLAERLKDVEAQRDALHSALKSLLERQDLQNRENTKRIRQLEIERDRLLTASPKKGGYEREVSKLREEISVLRHRAEEAIEQKWQVEKGLAGLKMDLDRAEGEIASLRGLLKEKDILIPEALARPGSSHSEHEPVSSDALEQAYLDLQAAYVDALERIKTLEEDTRTDEKTQLAIQRLEQSLSAAVSDRDFARNDASSYLTQLESFQTLEKQHLDTERDLASQLHESARRVEDLAQQVRAQLEANATLRTRLADTIARGEAEQRVSTERIAGLQNRLRTLEDQVVTAQTGAEERVHRHEEELSSLKESHITQLHRLRDASGGLRAPAGAQRTFPPKSPLSPMFSLRSPAERHHRLNLNPQTQSPTTTTTTRPGARRSTTEPIDMTAQMETLKARVAQLEGALASADAEMQEVVGRMGTAQIEVLQLQEQREEAVRETRKLRAVLEEERRKVFEGRWRSLRGDVE